jgi:hypothetical protein
MKEYFLLVDGMSAWWPGDQDPKGFSFWPLARVRWAPEEFADLSPPCSSFLGAEEFYVFGDYLGWSWAYAIKLGVHAGDNGVVLIGKDIPELVAGSFSTFVELYLEDAPALYNSPPMRNSTGA